MGLDMDLYSLKKSYGNFKKMEYDHWSSKAEEIKYWRKAFAIHEFFCRTVSGLSTYSCVGNFLVGKEIIEKLNGLVKKARDVYDASPKVKKQVLDKIELDFENKKLNEKYIEEEVVDNPLLDEIFPQTNATIIAQKYDKYYYKMLLDTIELTDKLLKDFDWENNYLIYSFCS